MIARILIRQLYDTYNYDIQFPENQRVTIITGPNGYGKTTFLKIINNLLTCNFWFFYLLKFKEIQIFFRNGMNISIQKKRIEAEDNNREDRTPASLKEKVFFRLNANESDEAYIEEFSLSYSDILRLRRQLLPTLSYRQTEEYDIEELLNKEYNIDSDISILEKSKNIRMFLQERKCSFIKEQRIIASTQHSGYDGRRRLLNQFEIDDIAAQKEMAYYDANKNGISVYEKSMTSVVMIPTTDEMEEYYMSRTKTAMDNMARSADSSLQAATDYQSEIVDTSYVVEKMQTVTDDAGRLKEAQDMINKLESGINEISDQLFILDKAYIRYKSQNYVSFTYNNASLVQRINVKKTGMKAAAVLAFMVGLNSLRKVRKNRKGIKKSEKV